MGFEPLTRSRFSRNTASSKPICRYTVNKTHSYLQFNKACKQAVIGIWGEIESAVICDLFYDYDNGQIMITRNPLGEWSIAKAGTVNLRLSVPELRPIVINGSQYSFSITDNAICLQPMTLVKPIAKAS